MAVSERALPPLTWLQRLGRSDDGESWRVRAEDGAVLVAKRIATAEDARRARIARALRATRSLPADHVVPVRDVVRVNGSLWILRGYDLGVSWARLSRVASPALSQVLALARALLAAVDDLHRAGVVHGALSGENVFVERDGRVRIADAGIRTPAGAGRRGQAADVAAAAGLVDELWRHTRRDAAPALAALLSEGRLAAAGDASNALALIDAAMGSAGPAPGEADAGVSALVARLLPREAGSEGAGDTSAERFAAARPGEANARAALAASLAASRWRQARTRLVWIALAACAAAAAAFIAAHELVHHAAPRATATTTARSTPRAAQAQPPRPVHTPAPRAAPSAAPVLQVLEPPAPAASGIVAAASVQTPSGPCTPGGSCAISSRIDLVSHPATTVTWEVVAVDGCSGATSALLTASVEAAPAYGYVFDAETVTLPQARFLSLYAVTLAPVRVASPPLRSAAPGATC